MTGSRCSGLEMATDSGPGPRVSCVPLEFLQGACRGFLDELEDWMLADRITALSSNGTDRVVDDLARAIAAGTTTTATG